MERVLFGDNQFFGVNHMSEEKARAQGMRFQSTEAIMAVINDAYSEGIKVFMCTTHDRISEVCDHVRGQPERYSDFQFYPCMPYAHKYANAATEHGIVGALKQFLPEEGALSAVLKGGVSVARKDLESLTQLLVDAELKMFKGLNTPVIFLQNVVTDFLLGLGFNEAFKYFADHIKNKYGAEPGFITMNLPKLLDVLDELGIENPVVCANFNKIGFRMCGGQKLYEDTVANRKCQFIAMSVLASGALPPREALEYVCQQSGVKSILFGASSRANIRATKKLIDELSPT